MSSLSPASVLYDDQGNPVSVIRDGAIYRLAVSQVSGVATSLISVSDFLKNGSNDSLKIDGSVTPVVFSFVADSTNDISISELRIVLSTGALVFDGTKFSSGVGLTNGLLISGVVNNGNSITFGTIKVNEDLVINTNLGQVLQAGVTDNLTASFVFGGSIFLKHGTGDVISITVRDNMTVAGLDIDYLKAKLFGNKVI